jgi:integrase
MAAASAEQAHGAAMDAGGAGAGARLMPTAATGEKLRRNKDGTRTKRITLDTKTRKREPFTIPAEFTDEQAEARGNLLADLAKRFRAAGRINDPDALKILNMAATCATSLLPGVENATSLLIGGQPQKKSTTPKFRELGNDWTSGKLHTLYPDQIKLKNTASDESHLAYLYEIDVGGMKLGDVPLELFTLDHAEAAMRQLPKRVKRPAARRQYAQCLSRVLSMAVYPCRYIKASPLPARGFMPKAGRPPAYPYLYPDEDRKLLGAPAEKVPLCYRVLWGFLAREGCRVGEACELRVAAGVDLERGVISIDKNKTGDARPWPLDPDVAIALRRWAALRDLKEGDLLFADDNGGPIIGEKLSRTLRSHLKASGVTRAELLTAGTNRGRMRVHDLRGTFVTLSLAAGKSESWVADRTGHTSSVMINRYKRNARTAAELGFRQLDPLWSAIPELRDDPTNTPQNTKAPWRNGIRRRLKIFGPNGRPGSSPGGATANRVLLLRARWMLRDKLDV